MNIVPIKTQVFPENADLVAFIHRHVPSLPEHSILAVTSKIVALSEGRTAIVKNEKQKEALIRQESQWKCG